MDNKESNANKEKIDSLYPIEVEALYSAIKNHCQKSDIDTTTIVSITITLMQVIESYKKLTGNQKKSIVLHTLQKYVNDEVVNLNNKIKILSFINKLLPPIIDTFISIDKQDIQIAIKSCCNLV